MDFLAAAVIVFSLIGLVCLTLGAYLWMKWLLDLDDVFEQERRLRNLGANDWQPGRWPVRPPHKEED